MQQLRCGTQTNQLGGFVLKSLLLSALLVPTLISAQAPAPAQSGAGRSDVPTWAIDPNHSELTFEIRHFVSRVKGTFKDWKGTITADPGNWSTGSVDVSVQTVSISTNNDRRDNDLRSSNFFAADSFPELSFKSTRVERTGETGKIYGNLTMRGVTRPVVLDAHFLGVMKAQGRDRMGFEATTTVNRTDWGITWNRTVEGGGVMLGDDVKIDIVVEAIRQGARG
jgi:polyisoprenoid-binding protein YceI